MAKRSKKQQSRPAFRPRHLPTKCRRIFRELAAAMNISNDQFIRTTEPRHIRASQAIWSALKDAGHIYLGTYAGWYAVRDEAFYTENEISDGPGGKKVGPSGAEVEWVEEPSYFFDLSKWQDRLLAFYEANPDAVAPRTRRNEVISFVSGGLHDLSISRTSFNWGVPVPDDPDHIMYVWLDALTNYLTAVGYPDDDSAMLSTYWPATLHMVGKDILRFHAVYWPAFLMGAGIAPPERVFAHGWWTNEGQKISKSVGNIIDPFEIVKRYGLDQMRYFLMREVPFGNDGDFSHRAIVNRVNGDLANDLGNLVQRVLSMIHRYCGGSLPGPGKAHARRRRNVRTIERDAATAARTDNRAELPRSAGHGMVGCARGQRLCRPPGTVEARQRGRQTHGDSPLCTRRDDPLREHRSATVHAGFGPGGYSTSWCSRKMPVVWIGSEPSMRSDRIRRSPSRKACSRVMSKTRNRPKPPNPAFDARRQSLPSRFR